ncbi:MAG: sigma 54-interacting transcriptional regulator, partial [Desulfonatronovibrionaceae bacterium]
MISKVASLDCTVLISGETGTGKELVSRAIHQKSSRGRGKFLAINCSAFGQDLLNNELFGYERETYSGNVRIKKGLFEAAQGGTILLDEICETPPAMQTHLLRVLEDKLIIRSGGTEEIPVDVRVLAATNQRLSKKMEDREFRRDLYYRLNTFVLRIPPLRERKEDIPLLANFFLGKYRKEYGKDIDRISGEAMQVLMDYSFPGNVRDLEHAIERA